MAEPENQRLRSVEQARRAAREFFSGGDGTSLAPPEIQSQVAEWKQRLDASSRKLDEEGWLIGLLTLACLPPPLDDRGAP